MLLLYVLGLERKSCQYESIFSDCIVMWLEVLATICTSFGVCQQGQSRDIQHFSMYVYYLSSNSGIKFLFLTRLKVALALSMMLQIR